MRQDDKKSRSHGLGLDEYLGWLKPRTVNILGNYNFYLNVRTNFEINHLVIAFDSKLWLRQL